MRPGDGTPGPGRPKGSKNRATAAIRESFEKAFAELQVNPGDPYSLAVWAKENPDKFYPLAIKLIPTEVEARIGGTLQHILGSLGRDSSGKSDDPPVA